jgi:hypothetical protein
MIVDFLVCLSSFRITWLSICAAFGSDSRMQRFTSVFLFLFTFLVLDLMVKPINQTLSKRVRVIVIHVLCHTSVQVQRLVDSR